MVPLALLKNMDLLVLLLILPRKYDVYKYKKVYCLHMINESVYYALDFTCKLYKMLDVVPINVRYVSVRCL